MKPRWIRAALAATAALALSACGGSGDDGGDGTAAGGTVTVFAAASLTEAFTRIGTGFEEAYPGATVTFNFAGSSALANQINQGAPADVFASAAPATMTTVTDAGNADGTPAVFVRNQLVIAVPKGNPKGIRALADLTGPGVKVALCAPQVPCGAAAKTALDAAGAKVTPVTLDQDDVDGVEFPESARAVNDYPMAVLTDAGFQAP